MKFILLSALTLCLSIHLKAQLHVSPDTIRYSPQIKTQVIPLASDSNCSTFFIVIPGEVKPHYHATHTENVIISEGEGMMRLGSREFKVKEGDIILIPKGTIHSVKSLGEKPLKVISVQSPYFDGKDRIMVEE